MKLTFDMVHLGKLPVSDESIKNNSFKLFQSCICSLSVIILDSHRYTAHLTVNVDIFTCINFRRLETMGNFACIAICVLTITVSLGYHISNFRSVHVFADI